MACESGGTFLADFIVNRCTVFVSFSLRTTWWLTSLIKQAEEGPVRLAIAQGILERIQQSTPQFGVPVLIHSDVAASPKASPKKGHRRSQSTGAKMLFSSWEHVDGKEARLGGKTAQIGRFPPVRPASSRAQSAGPPVSPRRNLPFMDTGHAFDWPTLPRTKSVNDLSSAAAVDEQERELAEASGGGAAAVVSDGEGFSLMQCMKAELNFVQALMHIGDKLRRFKSKDTRRSQLFAELALMNLNLPARVYLPLSSASTAGANESGGSGGGSLEIAHSDGPLVDHHVVRLPPQEAAILNSRDRVPYLLYVEALVCEHSQTDPLPKKMTLRSTPRRSGPLTGSLLLRKAPVAAAETREATAAGHVAVSDIRSRLIKASRGSDLVDINDPSAKAFREPWTDKLERIRLASPYGHLPNWRVVPVIVKNGDDLRQEVLASQVMEAFQTAWKAEGVAAWIKPLKVVVTSGDGGMIEVVGSGVSVHQVKRNYGSILEFLRSEFGGSSSEAFLAAQMKFLRSLAGYSIFTYFMQVKDRHNSNILLDGDGHIIHIDFGFMFSPANSPGGGMNFENAPFKLTQEFIEVMGGTDGDLFRYFRILMLQGFLAARKHMDKIMPILEIILPESKLPCLVGGQVAVDAFRARFALTMTEEDLTIHVNALIDASLASMRTQLYDEFQRVSNGIRV
jgi:phosphatidylinositol 4-kinase